MILEIITNTPIWVFILLIGLLYLGYSQTKDRETKVERIFILPIAMIFLSLFGIYSAFSLNLFALGLWLIGMGISLLIGLRFISIKNIRYDRIKDTFYIYGSWIPIVLILSVFSIKYSIGVITARKLPIMDQIEFIIFVSLIYGFISGLFLARSINILRSKNTK